MKIFIGGATGAIGTPLVMELLSQNYEVYGMTRSHDKAREMESLKVKPVLADALDPKTLTAELKKIKPDVVIEMLTALPKQYTPEAMAEARERNLRVRLEGGANLQRAASKAGAKRYIIQSAAFWYEQGEGLAIEETPLALNAEAAGIAAGCRVYAQMEDRVLQDTTMEGIVLRFGFFYGPGTWYARDGDMADQVRQQKYPVIGTGEGYWNFVHVEDAAKGIVGALNCPPGSYNINDDHPIPQSEWVPVFAKWLNAPSPPHRSVEEELQLHGPDSVYYAMHLRGASNQKAKKWLGFSPRTLEWLNIA